MNGKEEAYLPNSFSLLNSGVFPDKIGLTLWPVSGAASSMDAGRLAEMKFAHRGCLNVHRPGVSKGSEFDTGWMQSGRGSPAAKVTYCVAPAFILLDFCFFPFYEE